MNLHFLELTPNNSGMRIVLAVLVMTIVAPIAAVTTLVCWNPERWGGSINPLAILGMAFFGVITTPLWPTYIPAIVLTPLVVSRIARLQVFKRMPLVIICGVSVVIGGICGIAVISIVVPWHESLDLILNWVSADAVSGAVALAVISLIYRWMPSAEPCAPPNGGPATPPPIPTSRRGIGVSSVVCKNSEPRT